MLLVQSIISQHFVCDKKIPVVLCPLLLTPDRDNATVNDINDNC